jgi:hypothetical protein
MLTLETAFVNTVITRDKDLTQSESCAQHDIMGERTLGLKTWRLPRAEKAKSEYADIPHIDG